LTVPPIPPDGEGAVWEFYSPFAHVPGKYEWCRIHSPTHGSFDTFILLSDSTALPPWVYVNSVQGLRFLADRYPETRGFRAVSLGIEASPNGCVVRGFLRADTGPVRGAEMRLSAEEGDLPRAVPYGGGEFSVWGSRWSCTGVDLVREGRCDGRIEFAPLDTEGQKPRFSPAASPAPRQVIHLKAVPCLVSAGSFGKILPLHI
jgi:hypothetical protein